jgi:aminoglycoside phosphotransferase (APT) family kinase protein
MPAAEVDIDESLVRGLLEDQFPELAALELVEFSSGWDNVLYRLGDEFIVRLPRRLIAANLVEHEQRWLPELAPRLPLPIPTPIHAGRPGRGYPWSWSVCAWLDGEIAERTPPDDPYAAATSLGQFLAALHQVAPTDAPHNPYRGVPLRERDAVTRGRIDQLHDMIDRDPVLTQWEHALATPPWTDPPVWLHGDLHPGNILVDDGAIAAVVDFGDITAGDPATDLSVAWSLLPTEARGTFRANAGDVDDDTWARARGWALSLSLAYLADSADNALIAGIGQRMLAAVLSDPD